MMTVPAPTAGWDAQSPLSQMRPDAAIELVNLIPRARDVASRKGYASHTDDAFTTNGKLVAYNASTSALLACADGNIYNVTTDTETDLTGAITDFSNDQFIVNAYKNLLIFCNGEDTPVVFNGSTVAAISASGPTMTEVRGGVTYRGRVYYWEEPAGSNPQSFWYAAAGAYQGTLTEFELTEFTKGGYVVQMANWTFDGGAGQDDNLVIFMSTGEVLVYQGGDPGDATDWSLIGMFQIGEPVGVEPATQVGGDLIVLTKDGYLTLSAAIREGRYSENSAFSFQINPAAQDATESYGDNYGWHSVLHSGDGLFIVNVPISANESVQHVRNTATGAWCKWTGINAVSFAVLDGLLYFLATDGIVYVYGGTSDNGGFIPMRATQAYNYYGAPSQKKQVTTVEVQANYAFPKYIKSSFWADYNEENVGSIPDPPEPAPADWNVGEWNDAEWTTSELGTVLSRKNVQKSGYCLAHTIQLKSRAQRVRWYASHLYLTPMGVV